MALALQACKSEPKTTGTGVEGEWFIHSGNYYNGNPVEGKILINPYKDIYRIDWKLNGLTFSGSALLRDSTLYACWGGRNTPFGLTLLAPADEPNTVLGEWIFDGGRGEVGTFQAVGISGPAYEGNFDLRANHPAGGYGALYRGAGQLRRRTFNWSYEARMNMSSFAGVAINDGPRLVVGWASEGSKNFGVAIYKLSGDSLVGLWCNQRLDWVGRTCLHRRPTGGV